MIITNKVNLDLKRPSWITPIFAVQDDKYSRNIELTLTCDGIPWVVPADAVPVISYSKANGTGGLYDTLPDGTQAWTVQGNVLTVALAPQVLTLPGAVSLAVTLIQGQIQISTFALLIDVHPAVGAGIAPSEPYFHVAKLLPAPAVSSEGQFLRVKAVNELGHVTATEAVDAVSAGLPAGFTEAEGSARLRNPANASHSIWEQGNGRLAFGMTPASAPVPFLVDGQLLADGTIIARNTGSQSKNRWGFHVLEAYARDQHARLTLLLDKHPAEASGKPSAEFYYYIGDDHTAASYGNTKLGSDVAFHSFCFDRDKLTAYGEMDCKMPVTLARISLSQDLNSACDTVTAADATYEPETNPEENSRCLKYLALKNAENGAMFYDADRNCPVCKINGKWCDLPFTVITDSAYDPFQTSDSAGTALVWESGVIGGYGDMVANPNRIRTADYLPEGITTITAQEGYEFCLVVLWENGGANNDCYYNPNTNTQNSSPTWCTSLDIRSVSFEGYPKRKLIARRTDQAAIDAAEGIHITVS